MLGRNGVGKSTLMRAVIGLLPARAGRIRFKGEDVTGESADSALGAAWATCRKAARSSRT